MLNVVRSVVDGLGGDTAIVEAECHITNGLPSVVIIGYAQKAVDEAKDRLRASFANSSLNFPKKRITINLSPADVPKDSTSLDLAMAVAILANSQQVESGSIKDKFFLGELSLDGRLQPVKGIIGRLLGAKKLSPHATIYIPAINLEQCLLVPELNLKPARSLRDVFLDLSGVLPIKEINTKSGKVDYHKTNFASVDFSEIIGQPLAKRAMEIAAAGQHNILLHGPPGTGKTMLAKAICGILPDLTHEEILEVTYLHNLGGGQPDEVVTSRPFRSPHHTVSTIAIIGGGTKPRPGEASLAHRGVLFLDELPEFNRSSLEALRQPLEDGNVTVSRIKDTITYPANFILVATQNPCPCGYLGTNKPCICSAASVYRYQKKVSGPILDRIDLHLAVNDVQHGKLLDVQPRSSESIPIRQRVLKAYQRQTRRFNEVRYNSSMSNKELRELGRLSPEAKQLLDEAAAKLGISARAYMRSVKVARTIADLESSEEIKAAHISEALQYRQPVNSAALV